MGFTEKDKIRLDTQPLFNYLNGDDSIYLCNPIELGGTHTCIHIAAYQDALSVITHEHAIVMGVFMLYHYLLYRLLMGIIQN